MFVASPVVLSLLCRRARHLHHCWTVHRVSFARAPGSGTYPASCGFARQALFLALCLHRTWVLSADLKMHNFEGGQRPNSPMTNGAHLLASNHGASGGSEQGE